MKIKTEIEIEEIVTLRLAMNSLQRTLESLERLDKFNATIFSYDKENLQNARKIINNFVYRS